MSLSAMLEVPILAARRGPRGFKTRYLRSDITLSGADLRIRLDTVPDDAVGPPTLVTATQAADDLLPSVTNPVAPQLSNNTSPGQKTSAAPAVASPTSQPEVGALYLIRYEITDFVAGSTLFPGGASAFNFQNFPVSRGVHNVLLEADKTGTGAFLVVNGDITFASASLYKAEWTATAPNRPAEAVVVEVSLGDATSRVTTASPTPGEWYVANGGSNKTGTGALDAPFATPEFASAMAGPGDTIYIRPGVYAPFEVQTEGTSGNLITFTTLPGEERQAIIRGDLGRHKVFGGGGVIQTNETRDGIRCIGKSYVTIENLRVEYVWRDGIRVLGNGVGTVTTGITVRDCQIAFTGQYGVLMAGESPDNPVSGSDAHRLTNVLIEGCDVTQTNVITDDNQDSGNSLGGGGVGECITGANSVDGIVIRNNVVHDSLQYGIDLKNHVQNGEIYGNTITNVLRYGVYIDAGETDVQTVAVYNNVISGCRSGIVCAREEDGDDSGAELILDNIDIYNNVMFDLSRVALLLQKHPKDNQDIGFFRNIRLAFNTIYNSSTDTTQTYQDVNIDDIAAFGGSVVSGIELVGNVVWNPDGEIRCAVDVDGRFTVADNFNIVNGTSTGTDPLFTDPAGEDFTLQAGSPALGIVSGYSAAPFNLDAVGTTRADPADAGAFERA